MVIDLAVEDDPARVILIRERLPAADAIDDCEPAVAKCRVRTGYDAFAVRTAMAKASCHGTNGGAHLRRKRARKRNDAGDSAHVWSGRVQTDGHRNGPRRAGLAPFSRISQCFSRLSSTLLRNLTV